MTGNGLILAIESSCDETAAAVVQRGSRTLSSVVASQIATHARYGGVVPELASREHLRAIVPVVRAALEQAQVALPDLDAIAVTSGPGLAGALLVGITYAKALAYAQNIPLIAINHLEGHIHAVLLNERERQKALQADSHDGAPVTDEPVLALVVSGGHTHLYLARPAHGAWSYTLVGRTVDDAAGEAYDKVAKLLGLGYPGGPWIDALSQHGNPHCIQFSFAQVKTKVHLSGKAPRTKAATTSPIANLDPRFLFSFSGIKTAVLRYVELHNLRPEAEARREALFTGPDAPSKPTVDDALAACDPQTLDLIASFQHAVVSDLLKKTFAAQESLGVNRILVTGGVSANHELRNRFSKEGATRHLPVAFPTLSLSTDNAAMIAAAAWPHLQAGEFAPSNLSASPSLTLGL
jgi:N6-L-threonylcarbamoyladenine synthase